MSEIQIYTVEFAHPDYESPGIVDLVATSEHAAISRTRGSMFHYYRDARWYDDEATFTVTGVREFTPGWNREPAMQS